MKIKNTEKRIDEIFYILKNFYKPFRFSTSEPFKVLITTILSQRTRDENTKLASSHLFKIISSPEDILRTNQEVIENAIRPAGFYKIKTKRIINICRELVEKYGGKVPSSMDKLLNFKGVGRKTANAVLSFAFNKPAIVVDTHVHRISNRLGLLKSKTPYQTEQILRKILPEKYWPLINKLFVVHGQKVCKPLKPRCNECPIKNYCEKNI